MIDWIKTAQGRWDRGRGFATVGTRWNLGLPRLVFSPEAPNHARIAALEQSNRDTRLLVLDRRLVARQCARHALAGNACAFG